MLRAVANQCVPLAEEKRLRLRVVAPSVSVRSDPDMLARVLHNLVGNAIKYTRQGGVLVGIRRRGAAVLIQVIDTGVGIPADQQETIFEAFRQLEPQRGDGVGLGLSIVKRTLDALGHPIRVHSIVGRGTCLTVEVPRAP